MSLNVFRSQEFLVFLNMNRYAVFQTSSDFKIIFISDRL
jgi:hypothetical protein